MEAFHEEFAVSAGIALRVSTSEFAIATFDGPLSVCDGIHA